MIDAMDILGGVGYALDTPGALLRGLLGGSPGSRMSGRDMLQSWGALGENQDGFDMGDVAGFGADLAVDPLNLLGLGLLRKGMRTSNVAGREAAEAGVMNARNKWLEKQGYMPAEAASQTAAFDKGLGRPVAYYGPSTSGAFANTSDWGNVGPIGDMNLRFLDIRKPANPNTDLLHLGADPVAKMVRADPQNAAVYFGMPDNAGQALERGGWQLNGPAREPSFVEAAAAHDFLVERGLMDDVLKEIRTGGSTIGTNAHPRGGGLWNERLRALGDYDSIAEGGRDVGYQALAGDGMIAGQGATRDEALAASRRGLLRAGRPEETALSMEPLLPGAPETIYAINPKTYRVGPVVGGQQHVPMVPNYLLELLGLGGYNAGMAGYRAGMT